MNPSSTAASNCPPERQHAPLVAAVVPAYKVSSHILRVVEDLKARCDKIYVIDDCCPEGSGKLVESNYPDTSVTVLFHTQNQGVGGAVMTGYRQAIADGVRVILKVDGDGQMDADLIPRFVEPILNGRADYAKGNRFFDLSAISQMPKVRIFGNATLSFFAKLSTGYWNTFDPTNGFTAIHADVARRLPLEK